MKTGKSKKRNSPIVMYWEACLFISYMERTPERFEILDSMVLAAEKGKVIIQTSLLTTAEAFKKKSDKALTEIQASRKKFQTFFENDWIQFIDVDLHILEKATEIRIKHGLKLGDAIHLASAISQSSETYNPTSELLTYDGRIIHVGKSYATSKFKVKKPEHIEPFELLDKKPEDEPTE